MKLNPRKSIVRASLLGLAVYGCVGVAGAADFYVSPTGDDLNDGLTPGTAKRTLTGATGAIFAANSSAGADTINCAAGDYSAVPEPGTVAITEAVSILGPVGVRTTDPSTYYSSTRTRNDSANEAYFSTAVSSTNGAISVQADNVTIQGISLQSTATTNPIIAVVGARANTTISYNFIWRTAPGGTTSPAQRAISFLAGSSPLIEYNSIQNVSGSLTGTDNGVIHISATSNAVVRNNEIRNPGDIDRSVGVLIAANPASSTTHVDRNVIWGNGGLEHVGKYGIAVSGTNPVGSRVHITNNIINDAWQANISCQSPRLTITGNKLSCKDAGGGGTAHEAVIYVRDASVTDVIASYNQVGPSILAGATALSPRAGIRFNAHAAATAGTMDFLTNSVAQNVPTANSQDTGLGIQSSTATVSCANAIDARNTWWGSAQGPRDGTGTAYAAAMTDACDGTARQTTGAGARIGISNATTMRLTFAPWALFKGTRNILLNTGASVTTIDAIATAPAGNDRYSKHSVSLPGTTALTTVNIWSPAERTSTAAVLAVNNAAHILLDPPTTLTGNGTVTVEYTDTGVTAAANDRILSPFFPTAAPETAMRLAKWNGSAWEFIPSTVNTTDNTVTATIASIAAAGDVYGAMPSPLPEVTNTVGANTLNKPGPAVVVDAGVTVTDANSPTLDRVTVTITNLLDGANEVLAASPSGGILAGDISYSAGVLTVDPAAPQSLADFQAVLASVTYDNTAGSPNVTPRVLAFSAVDADAPAPGPFTSLPSSKTVNLNVVANVPPTANNDTLNANETVSTPGNLTANDSDGTIASYTIVTPPTLGSISGFNAATGAYNYTSGNFTSNQSDSLQFIATDNVGADSTTATISINITAANDNPTATADTLNVTEGIGAPGTLQGTDADNAITGYTITTPPDPAKGAISGFNPSTGTYIYTAVQRRANTTDALQFTVSDALGGVSTPATISVNITAVDDAPTLNDGSLLSATVGQGGSVTITSTMLAINDIDTPEAERTITVVAAPAVGSLSPGLSFTMADILANTVSYTHNGTGVLTDSFDFTYTDGTTTSALPVTFGITVTSAVHDWTLND